MNNILNFARDYDENENSKELREILMRRLITLFLLAFALCVSVSGQQMTDDQVVQYVKEAKQAGKADKQIVSELMRRGITKEQVERIREKYESEGTGNMPGGSQMQNASRSRQRTQPAGWQNTQSRTGNASRLGMRVAEGPYAENGMAPADSLNPYELYPEAEEEDPSTQIFGHNIFTNPNLTFEPSMNIATPENYRLGPGDEVIIDVWGASETTIRQEISPEGSILVNNLGPVYLNGKTVEEANAYLKQEFAKIYSGVSGNLPSTQVKLTLGQIRSIQVNVMGEVAVPGTYTLSAFASVFHALYRAGGVNSIGTLRAVKVMRGERPVAVLDVYDYIMRGKLKDDVRLQDGDVIVVSPYLSLVHITGKVKRPMYYELKPEETMENLLKYAGNFTGDAYKKSVRVIRKSGREQQIYNVDDTDYAAFRMDDGDEVSVDSVLQRFENRVEVRGAVYREGLYQLSAEVSTVLQLIRKADGLRGDAFLNRAILDREHEDLTHEIIPVDVKGLINGVVPDVALQKNDVLYIPSIHDLQEEATLTIHGEVANPGTYLYSDGMTIEDLVVQAGGLLEAAATTKVEVARRTKNPKSSDFSTVIGETFVFDLKDGLLIGKGSGEFHLQPFDEVYIRRSPAYHAQQNVSVEGEVLFSGSYALSKKNERLSDLVKKAGGITPDAYVKGARLVRKMTEEELRRKDDMLRIARTGADSINVSQLDLADSYSVGINLDLALARPGSDYDMVLREGDLLIVPEYVNTVKINGAVMYPNTVSYKKGESLRYYINQAGGYGNNAKKRKVYVVYMNGTVSRLKSRSTAIEPGCEIIVPQKSNRNKMSATEIFSLGTSAASLATMVATLVNLFK